MNYRIWYSTESFADYIIAKTNLNNKVVIKKKMYESDANNAKVECEKVVDFPKEKSETDIYELDDSGTQITRYYVNKDSIENAYPEENIK